MTSKYSILFAVCLGACVSSGTHEAVQADLAKTRTELSTTTEQRDQTEAKLNKCDENMTLALDQNQQLATKISSMGQNVEQLVGEKGALTQERERLQSEQKNLASEIAELRRMRQAAEARDAQYRQVVERLQKMVDAGTLQVKMRNGRMVVQMSSDVVFPPGATRIKPEARDAIVQVAQAVKQFPDRKFQVVGHSDSKPINTPRFPSNWELSSQRAIEVVKLMIEEGVPGEMLSAAGNAEFDPLVANDNPADQSMNRRVEIVFLPKLSELPGLGESKGSVR